MIFPGTKIICPVCDLHIATAALIVEQDEDGSIYWDDFEWVLPRYLTHTQSRGTNCPRCQTSWSDTGGYLHTDKGWQEI